MKGSEEVDRESVDAEPFEGFTANQNKVMGQQVVGMCDLERSILLMGDTTVLKYVDWE